MFAQARDHQFHNSNGDIMTVLFADDVSILLEVDDDEKTREFLALDVFSTKLHEKTLFPKPVEKTRLILSPVQQATRDSRIVYIHTLRDMLQNDETLKPTTSTTYQKMIEVVEENYPALRGAEHPKKTTINRYWKTWISSRFNDDSLICKSRSHTPRIGEESNALIDTYLSTTYQDSRHKVATGHYACYKQDALKARETNPNIIVASKRTFSRRIEARQSICDKLDDPKTPHAERQQLSLNLIKRIKLHYPLQRVELDCLHTNIRVIDDVTGELTEPVVIYYALDCYTRAPLSMVFDYGKGEATEVVLQLIQNTYLRDDNLPFCGKTDTFIMDNGPAFNNKLIKSLCEQLGSNIVYTPSNTPSAKPFVESHFRVFRQKFESMVVTDSAGNRTVGLNTYPKKGTRTKINPLKNTHITASTFTKIINTMLTEYAHKTHSGLNCSPIFCWQQSRVVQSYYDYDSIKHHFHVATQAHEQQLDSRGFVRVLKHRFTSVELKKVHTLLMTYGHKNVNPTVQVFYNPYDASSVTVSVVLPNETEARSIVAYNYDEEINSRWPVSFAQLNGKVQKGQHIFQTEKHQVTGQYAVTIDRFIPAKTVRIKRSGKPTSSFEDNNTKELSIEQRIQNANATDSLKEIKWQNSLDKTELADKQRASQLNEPEQIIDNTQRDTKALW
ncbi:transposase family protein [Shewanella sp. SM95]|uniref:transposase family protein n=1 Tax=Shewanella sp. SM95 TaxID=2912812 RepID=UPI0021D7D408|nr:transposase family protein [Shewanella sp. SM95]MCU7997470.1 transposase family protein [Shewanella sp. SM95]